MKARRAARSEAARLVATHGDQAYAVARAFVLNGQTSTSTEQQWRVLREVEKLLGLKRQPDTATRYFLEGDEN